MATLNLAQYRQSKAAGTAKIVKLNGAPHLAVKGFDPNDGKPAPQLMPLSLDAAEKDLAAMEQDVATLKELVSDIKNAEEKLDAKP